MGEELVRVVCSKARKEIYCLINSSFYEREYKEKEKDWDIVDIEHCYLRELVSDWSYNKLIEISKL